MDKFFFVKMLKSAEFAEVAYMLYCKKAKEADIINERYTEYPADGQIMIDYVKSTIKRLNITSEDVLKAYQALAMKEVESIARKRGTPPDESASKNTT